jgi:hypothetical protein
MREMHAKRIDPECVGKFRITRRDMSGDASTEAKGREDAEACSKPFLSVLPLLFNVFEAWWPRRLNRGSYAACLLAAKSLCVSGIDVTMFMAPSLGFCTVCMTAGPRLGKHRAGVSKAASIVPNSSE